MIKAVILIVKTKKTKGLQPTIITRFFLHKRIVVLGKWITGGFFLVYIVSPAGVSASHLLIKGLLKLLESLKKVILTKNKNELSCIKLLYIQQMYDNHMASHQCCTLIKQEHHWVDC